MYPSDITQSGRLSCQEKVTKCLSFYFKDFLELTLKGEVTMI